MKTWYGFCGVNAQGDVVSSATKQPDWDTRREHGVTMHLVEVRVGSSSPELSRALAILRTGGDFATAEEVSGIPAARLIELWRDTESLKGPPNQA